MTFAAAWSVLGVALLVAASAGCSGGSSGSGGTAGAGGTPTQSTTSSTDATTSSTTVTGTGGGAPLVPSGFACSGAKPVLSTDVVPITQPNCSTKAACHLAMQSGSGVHDQLVNRIAEECLDIRMMVQPSDPEHSYVIHKLTNHNLCTPATTMPLDMPMLSTQQIQVIYDWICEGAPNN